MPHYICHGGCHGVSPTPGVCQTENCSKKSQSLDECFCTDGSHQTGEKCAKCGKPANGYKCEMCGAESYAKDLGHPCGGEHFKTKCSVCNQSESKCAC